MIRFINLRYKINILVLCFIIFVLVYVMMFWVFYFLFGYDCLKFFG